MLLTRWLDLRNVYPKFVSRITFAADWSTNLLCNIFSVANLATFQTPLVTFFFKRLATNLATFGKTLATFQMLPVLSCEHEILSYASPCVCSDQWALAPAERSSTADIDVNDLRMCTRCCHGPITCLLLLCLKENYLIWPFFLLPFFYLMHLYYSLSQSFSSFQFLNSSKIVYWAMSERLYVLVLTHTQQYT